MWYKNSQAKNKIDKKEQPKPMSADEKLVLAVTCNLIRQKLFLRGQYDPANKLVSKLAKNIMEQIQGQYHSIRSNITSEELTPIIKPFVDKLYRK